MIVLTWAIVVLSVVVLLPSLVLLVEFVAALFPLRSRVEEPPAGATTVVLAPAHDESASIGASLASAALAVGLAWLRYGRQSVPFWYLLVAPIYLLWKLPLYLSFSLGRRERQWRPDRAIN